MNRTAVWFSCGAASAVATKLAVDKAWPQTHVLYCATGGEHSDNQRFRRDCARWYGVPITSLRAEKYRTPWDVWEQRRFLNGPKGALCTSVLKRDVRAAWQHPTDTHVFGFTFDEERRACEFEARYPDLEVWFPLIDARLTKADCFDIVSKAGIRLPKMYRLGYKNNNCIGCVKGGMGYWNKVRRDFPEVFARMAALERRLGRTCVNGVYLDELDPLRGRYALESDFECGVVCRDGRGVERGHQ